MHQLTEYLHMGGYAMFVWPAYGLALLGLVGILWSSIQSWKAHEAEFTGLKAGRDSNADSGVSS